VAVIRYILSYVNNILLLQVLTLRCGRNRLLLLLLLLPPALLLRPVGGIEAHVHLSKIQINICDSNAAACALTCCFVQRRSLQ
jgi:hypothetical protein